MAIDRQPWLPPGATPPGLCPLQSPDGATDRSHGWSVAAKPATREPVVTGLSTSEPRRGDRGYRGCLWIRARSSPTACTYEWSYTRGVSVPVAPGGALPYMRVLTQGSASPSARSTLGYYPSPLPGLQEEPTTTTTTTASQGGALGLLPVARANIRHGSHASATAEACHLEATTRTTTMATTPQGGALGLLPVARANIRHGSHASATQKHATWRQRQGQRQRQRQRRPRAVPWACCQWHARTHAAMRQKCTYVMCRLRNSSYMGL